jgi:hypothetical protein
VAKNLPRLAQIHLKPTREKSALLFRLTFAPSQPHYATIEFELRAEEAMHLLSALQGIQRNTRWRVPQFFGSRGKANLRLVKNDD